MTKFRATAVGFGAVVLWAVLALFTVGSAPVPPFLLTALGFSIGGAIGILWILATGQLRVLKTIPLGVYVFGTISLFGYHALYFSALRMAPAAEAGLIAYLWPLLIVLFSGLLPGERLKSGHVIGGLIGFLGAAVILAKDGIAVQGAALFGYGLAGLCALTWSSYSVISRRMGNVPTAAVAVFCVGTAVLSLGAHFLFEDTVWPVGPLGWGAVVGLGLGPVGLAFYVWDIGVKQGDIQLLGVASYAAPLLSTFVLIIAGFAQASWPLLLAAGLIAGGATLAARASVQQK